MGGDNPGSPIRQGGSWIYRDHPEAFRYENKRWVLLGRWGSETEDRIPPFDAVALDLTRWWLPEQT